jgi:hypothetical protein
MRIVWGGCGCVALVDEEQVCSHGFWEDFEGGEVLY